MGRYYQSRTWILILLVVSLLGLCLLIGKRAMTVAATSRGVVYAYPLPEPTPTPGLAPYPAPGTVRVRWIVEGDVPVADAAVLVPAYRVYCQTGGREYVLRLVRARGTDTEHEAVYTLKSR